MKITKRKLDEGREDDEFPDSPLELQELSGDELEDSDICSSEDSGVEESNVRSDEEKSLISLPGKVTSSKKHEDDDTSDEEDIRNSVGNIPMKWYEKFPHIGYNLDGKKILKPIRNLDELDKFLDKMDNPDHWKTVYDETTGRNHIMTPEEISLIGRLTSGKFYDSSIDPYAPYLDFFTNEKMIHPLTNAPEHKRSFIPSLQEKQKVGKLVHAIKMGWLKPRKEKTEEDEQPKFYDLWQEEKEDPLTHSQIARRKMHIPAPKPKLPGHEASYNPPLEYLPTEEEKLAWDQEDPEDRKTNFLPQKYDCLRRVPQYSSFIQDAFARCLDLYLCPRQRKMRVNVDPEDLIPKLPKPSDLQPFPTRQALCYNGHENIVRTISVDASGQWIASGSDDKTIRVWEVSTGRCIRIITVSEVVKCVSWCPNASVCLLAASVGENILIINPYVGDRVKCQATDQLLHSYEEKIEKDSENPEENNAKQIVNWQIVEPGKDFKEGIRIVLNHGKPVSKVTWHSKGDYFASILPGNGHNQVLLHQLTKRRSQNPFSKTKGMVQCVLFHPHRPFLLVATQKFVRIYNLVKQILSKKLIVGVQWISCMAIHPKGDDVLIGSYDCRLSWFDMDLSVKPYQTLRYHTRAIRACAYHNRYPLFASASDDGSIVVSHGMVYSDLLQNPLIVPVKVLKGHKVQRNLGVLDCCFHPTQPWIFSSAADNTIRLYT